MNELDDIKKSQPWLIPSFRDFFQIADFTPKAKDSILDVGCGKIGILDYMTFLEIYQGQLDFSGIDIDQTYLETIYKYLSTPHKFTIGDERHLTSIYDNHFDIIYVRNPNAESSEKTREIWQEIFQECKNVLSKEGIMIIKHYTAKGQMACYKLFQEIDLSTRIGINHSAHHRENGDGDNFPTLDRYFLIGKLNQ